MDTVHSFVYCTKISFRQDDVGVENDEPFAVGAFGAVVTALARAAVGLHEILHIEPVGVFVDHSFAVALRTIFDDQYLKVRHRLLAKTFK